MTDQFGYQNLNLDTSQLYHFNFYHWNVTFRLSSAAAIFLFCSSKDIPFFSGDRRTLALASFELEGLRMTWNAVPDERLSSSFTWNPANSKAKISLINQKTHPVFLQHHQAAP